LSATGETITSNAILGSGSPIWRRLHGTRVISIPYATLAIGTSKLEYCLTHCKCCDLCPGKFCDQSLLDYHPKVTHTECSYCGKFFLNAAAYKTHKIYEHKFARCPACFTTQEACYEHWNLALPCQLCPTDRTETWHCTQTALREHQKKAHAKCSVCSELFRDRNRCDAHKSQVHCKCSVARISARRTSAREKS
jgi:hypothetical protein